jgi:hypothetical protein
MAIIFFNSLCRSEDDPPEPFEMNVADTINEIGRQLNPVPLFLAMAASRRASSRPGGRFCLESGFVLDPVLFWAFRLPAFLRFLPD